MTKKEQFLAFVEAGAQAQDDHLDGHDCPLIMRVAGQIPEDRIPDNVINAAKVYLAYCNGAVAKPHAWMLGRK